jgi:hypothetical protein
MHADRPVPHGAQAVQVINGVIVNVVIHCCASC